MKKYFLHNGTESSGPFDLEELKSKRIIKNTPVWFEGLENWKTAGDIPELRTIFVLVPPPFTTISATAPKPKQDNFVEERTFLGMSKKTFLIVLVSLIILVATLVINTLEENRKRDLEIRNHKTEVENHRFELQQKELNEQKTLVEEAEKAEAERNKNERKHTIVNRIFEIKNLLAINSENLEVAKKKLEEISSFKLFRSAEEKKEGISLLQKEISNYTTEKENLKNESDELKLELEKIK